MNIKLVLTWFTSLAAVVWIDMYKDIKGYKKNKPS